MSRAKKQAPASPNTATATSKPIHVTADWMPNLTVNHRYGKTRGGGLYLKPEVRSWMAELAWSVRGELVDSRGIAREFAPSQRFRICVDYYLPSSGGDADNYLKSIWDALKVGLRVDDKYFEVGQGKVERGKHDRPRFEITIVPIEEVN